MATEQYYDSSYSSYSRKNYIPTKLTKVTITDATRIPYGAFCACRNITEINLNNEIVDIEGKAFYNTSAVKSFTIPLSAKNIGESAFCNCTGITNIIIPDSVITLGKSAFSGCTNLTSITLSDKTQVIESNTFLNCSKLQNVSIPDGVTTIGNSAFSGCKSFTYIRVPDAVVSIGNYAFDGCTNVLSVHIGDSVNTIGEYAFRNLSLIENVNVPKNVTSIGSSAFSGCGSIKEITLPFVGKSRSASSSEGLFGYIFGSSSYTGGVSTEQEYSSSYDATYYIPTKLTKVTITDAAKLSYGAFYGCTRISEIVLNNTISSVERYAFYNTAWYSNLKDEFCIIGDNVLIKCNTEENTVIIPNNVKHIAANVFYGNDKILEIVLPDQLESIGEYAFYGVKGVSTYTIPSSVTLIKNNAFSSGITIKCFSGSYAQTYAKNNNITTIILDQSETIPMEFTSPNVTLNRVTVDCTGYAMELLADNTNLILNRTINLMSSTGNAVVAKNVNVGSLDSSVLGLLNVTGNIIICGTLADDYEAITVTDGEIKYVSEEEFENYINSHKVTFDANGGTVSEESRMVPINSAFGELPEPSRDYYTFDGWYTEATGGDRIEADSLMTALTDITLYAHWVQNDVSAWVAKSQMPADAELVNTKYTYTLKSYTTSGSSSLSGWTKYNTTWAWSSYGSWSGWQDGYIGETEYVDVETRSVFSHYNKKTQYHYFTYYSGSSAPWSHYSSSHPNFAEIWVDYQLPFYKNSGGLDQYGGSGYDFGYPFNRWLICDGSTYGGPGPWTRTVDNTNSPVNKTQYRSRSRSKVYTYYYYKTENKESASYPSTPSGCDVLNVVELVQYRTK